MTLIDNGKDLGEKKIFSLIWWRWWWWFFIE